MKKCPFCAEQIEDDAKLCRWCHSDLTAPAVPPEPETSGMAIGSLITGIFFFIFPSAIAAVVLGHVSRARIRRSAGRLKGSGMARAGLILGYIGLSVLPILIAAIAIPNLLRARMAANEASAVSALRTMNTACITYVTTYGSYPRAQSDFAPPSAGERPSRTSSDLLDDVLSRSPAMKNGYTITFIAGTADANGTIDSYQITAAPTVANQTGTRYFFTDQTGIIRVQVGAPASANSPPLQ